MQAAPAISTELSPVSTLPHGGRGAWTVAAVAFFLVLLVPHVGLLRGHVSPIWDGLEFFGPYFMLVGDFTRNKQFLLWNPFIYGGAPDYTEPQLGSFSPLVLFFGLMFGGSRLGFELYWLAIWLLGGAGVLALARHLGAPAWGGFASALAFAFSGFYTGNAEHTSILATVSFLPLSLWRLDVALTERRYRPAAETGALYGLSALAGYPAMVLLNACFSVLWSLGRACWPDAGRPDRIRATLRWTCNVHVIVALVGLAVMSPSYVPFFVEGPGFSLRPGGLPRDLAVEDNALHPAGLVTLVNPALTRANIFEYTDISLRSLYLGCTVPVLALSGLLIARRSAFRWWVLVIGFLFLASAMGRALPLRGWLYDWFLLTRFFRASALFGCYFLVALTLLGILGAHDVGAMLRTRAEGAWRNMVIACLCLAVPALFLHTQFAANLRDLNPAVHLWAHLHTFGLWLVLLFVLGLASVLGWKTRTRAVPLVITVLSIADAWSTAGMLRPIMYGNHVDQWRGLDSRHRTDVDLSAHGLMRHEDNGGNFAFVSKRPALRGYSALVGPFFYRYNDEPALRASATGADRIWFSTSVAMTDRSNECFEAFRTRAATLGVPPLVVHPVAAMRHAPPRNVEEVSAAMCPVKASEMLPATRLDAAAVRTEVYTPTRLRLQVNVPNTGWLLVTDSWSRGWSATVNGRSSPVAGGNFVFRAVQVRAGRNVVDFRYEAYGFPWLLALSWSTLAVTGLFGCLMRPSRNLAQPHRAAG